MAFIPSRREHARFACKLSMQALGAGSRGPMDGTMLNVGMGGALVRLKGLLPRSPFTVRVVCGEESMSLNARVVRIAGLDPDDRQWTLYGLEFIIDPQMFLRVRILVDRVRSGSNPGANGYSK